MMSALNRPTNFSVASSSRSIASGFPQHIEIIGKPRGEVSRLVGPDCSVIYTLQVSKLSGHSVSFSRRDASPLRRRGNPVPEQGYGKGLYRIVPP